MCFVNRKQPDTIAESHTLQRIAKLLGASLLWPKQDVRELSRRHLLQQLSVPPFVDICYQARPSTWQTLDSLELLLPKLAHWDDLDCSKPSENGVGLEDQTLTETRARDQ
jgi:hypothetical protein